MKLKPVAVENFKGFRKTKLQKFIIEFIESGAAVAEVLWNESDYKTYSSVQSSLATSIKKMNKSNIKVKAIDRRIYLINNVLYEQEVEKLKNGKAKKEESSDTFTKEKEKATAGISTE